jgi:hypothetical protein
MSMAHAFLQVFHKYKMAKTKKKDTTESAGQIQKAKIPGPMGAGSLKKKSQGNGNLEKTPARLLGSDKKGNLKGSKANGKQTSKQSSSGEESESDDDDEEEAEDDQEPVVEQEAKEESSGEEEAEDEEEEAGAEEDSDDSDADEKATPTKKPAAEQKKPTPV